MPIQKTYRNGNSVAVTIPKDYLTELNFTSGSTVSVEKKGRTLVITPHREKEPVVDAKFMQMVDEFASDHADVLRQLAHK